MAATAKAKNHVGEKLTTRNVLQPFDCPSCEGNTRLSIYEFKGEVSLPEPGYVAGCDWCPGVFAFVPQSKARLN